MLHLYTKLKEIIEGAKENGDSEQEEIDKINGMFLSDSSVQLDKIKALAESTQGGNEIEVTNDDIQQIEVKQGNNNTENNDNKEVKKAKTSKPKKV